MTWGRTLARRSVGGGLLLAGLWAGLACEIDGSIGRDAAAGTATDATSTTAAASGDTTGASGGDVGEESLGTSMGGAEGGGTGMASTAADGESTGAPPICEPVPDDTDCARCRKESCCSVFEACVAHDTCLCWWECIATGGTTEHCGTQCGDDGGLYGELHMCEQSHCESCAA